VCCSVLQCVAVCCSVLQCVAVCCSVSPCIYKYYVEKVPANDADIKYIIDAHILFIIQVIYASTRTRMHSPADIHAHTRIHSLSYTQTDTLTRRFVAVHTHTQSLSFSLAHTHHMTRSHRGGEVLTHRSDKCHGERVLSQAPD